MDPVSAIGVAAATVQFVQFSLQALSLCREIRDNAEGTTNANKRLESYSQTLQALVRGLKAGTARSSAAGRRIAK